MRSRLKYNLEDKMSRIKVGKEFEGNKDQIKDNIMKILLINITMIVMACVTLKTWPLRSLKMVIWTY